MKSIQLSITALVYTFCYLLYIFTSVANASSIKLQTYDIGGSLNYASEIEIARINNVINQIKSNKADAICLQNVNNRKLQTKFYNQLQEVYPYWNSAINDITDNTPSLPSCLPSPLFKNEIHEQITLQRCLKESTCFANNITSTNLNKNIINNIDIQLCATQRCSKFTNKLSSVCSSCIISQYFTFKEKTYEYCLQNTRAFNFANNNIKNISNSILPPNNNFNEFENSFNGLLFLSKYKLNNKSVIPLTSIQPFQKIVLNNQFEWNGKNVSVLCTSLTSICEANRASFDYGVDVSTIRTSQLTQLNQLNNITQQIIQSALLTNTSSVFLLGQFNTGPANAAKDIEPIFASNYKQLLDTPFNWNNTATGSFCTFCNSKSANNDNNNPFLFDSCNAILDADVQIDHTFVVTNSLCNATVSSVDQIFDDNEVDIKLADGSIITIKLSTHFGVEIIFDVNCTTNVIVIQEADSISSNDYTSTAIIIWIITAIIFAIIILMHCCAVCCLAPKKSENKNGNITFSFANMNIWVDNTPIVKGVSGIVKPGQMLAIMGPSGSGKTTLLNILSGNALGYDFAGSIMLNGNAVSESLTFTKKCLYVTQQDNFMYGLTVYELLSFSAAFQLPQLSFMERKKKVDNVLKLLDLDHVKSSIVTKHGGLSGGQKRRLMLATEGLIASDIKLLLLDEITTGLSSKDAKDVVSVIKKLAVDHNFTIIATIHQPSRELFGQFDRVLLLRQGEPAYFGNTTATQIGKYFEAIRTARAIGERKRLLSKDDNLANSIVDAVSGDGGAEATDFWKSDDCTRRGFLEDEIGGQPVTPLAANSKNLFVLAYTILRNQIHEIFTWMILGIVLLTRDGGVIWLNLLCESLRLLITSLIFLQIDADTTEEIPNIIGALVTLVVDLGLLNPWVAFYGKLIPVVKYEISRGRYGIVSHNIIWTFLALVRIIAISLPTLGVAYWIIGLEPTFKAYAITITLRWIWELWVVFIGFPFAFLTEDINPPTLICLGASLVGMAFMGFYVQRDTIPSWVVWVTDVNFLTYLMEVLTFTQMRDLNFTCHDSVTIENCSVSGEQVLDFRGFKDRILLDYAVMFLWIAILMFISFFITILWICIFRYRIYRSYVALPPSYQTTTEIIDDNMNNANTTIESENESDDETMVKKRARFRTKIGAIPSVASRKNWLRKSVSGRKNTLSTLVPNSIKSEIATYTDLFNKDEEQQEEDAKEQVLDSLIPHADFQSDLTISLVNVSVKNLSYSVHNSKWYSPCLKKEHFILKNISIDFKPGELVAIIGPSGSGKTTFLEVVGGRKHGGTIYGDILVNNNKVKSSLIAERHAAFLEQFPKISPTMTVYEVLLFYANMQLPITLSRASKKAMIHKLANILELTKILNNPIGDQSNPSISGGQYKRVALAAHCLLTTSRLLILDEPTSGLSAADSATLLFTLRALVRLCQYTILITIHQPRTQVFNAFDSVLVLAKGETVFHGSPQEGKQLLARAGVSRTIDPHCNIAELFLDAVSDDAGAARMRELRGQETSNTASEQPATTSSPTPALTPFILLQNFFGAILRYFFQFYYILKRDLFKLWRNIGEFIALIIQSIIVSVLLAILVFQVADDAETVFDKAGIIFFFVIDIGTGVVSLAYSIAAAIPRQTSELERSVYPISAGLISDIIIIILQFIPYTICSVIVFYSIVGFTWEPQKVFIFMLATFLLELCIYSWGIMLIVLFETATIAATITSPVVSLSIVMGGFFVRFQDVPAFMRWLRWLSPISYATEMMYMAEFRSETYDCEEVETAIYLGCPIVGDEFLDDYGFEDTYYVVLRNSAILCSFCVALLFLTYCIIRRKVTGLPRRSKKQAAYSSVTAI